MIVTVTSTRSTRLLTVRSSSSATGIARAT